MSTRTCSIDGCDRTHFSRGMCHTHYANEKRRRRARLAQEYRALLAAQGEEYERDPTIGLPGDGCRIQGCTRPHEAHGLCKRHYRAALRREQARLAREYGALLAAEGTTP